MRLSTTTRPGRARVQEGLKKESPVIKFVGVRAEIVHKDEFIDSRPNRARARSQPKRRFRLELGEGRGTARHASASLSVSVDVSMLFLTTHRL